MFPTLRNGLKNPPSPRATLPVARPAVRPDDRTSVEGLTASMVGGWATAWPWLLGDGCAPAASRWPAMRPATRIPMPNTRPMVCGFIPDYDGISGDGRQVSASNLLTAVALPLLWS